MSVKWSGTKIPSPKVPSPKLPSPRTPSNRVQYNTGIRSTSTSVIPVEKLFIESEIITKKPENKIFVYAVSGAMPISHDEVTHLTN